LCLRKPLPPLKWQSVSRGAASSAEFIILRILPEADAWQQQSFKRLKSSKPLLLR
jgi:hypothetical protein